MSESERLQQRLWDMAVANARTDMNSDVAALYIESLNDVINVHAMRVSVGLHARIPTGIWLALYALIVLGMFAVGYHTAIAESRRTWMLLVLALSFSLVITLIGALDRAQSGYLPVSQQPLEALRVVDGRCGHRPAVARVSHLGERTSRFRVDRFEAHRRQRATCAGWCMPVVER